MLFKIKKIIVPIGKNLKFDIFYLIFKLNSQKALMSVCKYLCLAFDLMHY